MARRTTFSMDDEPFKKLIKAVDRAGAAGAAAPLGAMFTQWGARYMTFARRQFQSNSRGGGGWEPLKAQTGKRRKKARRSSKGKRRHAILRDTGTLFNAMSIGMAGNLNERLRGPARIRVGFSNDAHNSDALTIQQLAVIHDGGTKHIPARPILVDPDAETIRGMMRDSAAATEKLLRGLAI